MQILEFEPQFWILVKDGADLILEVNCEHGAAGYSFSFILDEIEKKNFSSGGRKFLNKLAAAVNYSAPGVRGSASSYQYRRLSPPRDEQLDDSIASWIRSANRNSLGS